MELSQIKPLETQEVRAVTGDSDRFNLSFVSLMCFSHWTCSVSSGLADILKNKCDKLPCNMLQEIKGYGLILFLVGHCIFNVFRDS